jgi:Flp pilus assembly protein TadD
LSSPRAIRLLIIVWGSCSARPVGPAEALGALDTSLRLQPDNARAHNHRGSALQVLCRVAEAEQAFQRALDRSPELELPYINLGYLLEEQGKVRQATELYERAISRGLYPGLFSHYLAAAPGEVTRRAPTAQQVPAYLDCTLAGDAGTQKNCQQLGLGQ